MNNLPGNKKPRNNCRWSSFDGSGAVKVGPLWIHKMVDVSSSRRDLELVTLGLLSL